MRTSSRIRSARDCSTSPPSASSRGVRARIELQERLRLLAEQREQDQLLLARREPLGLLAHVLGGGGSSSGGVPSREQRDGARDASASIGSGGVP